MLINVALMFSFIASGCQYNQSDTSKNDTDSLSAKAPLFIEVQDSGFSGTIKSREGKPLANISVSASSVQIGGEGFVTGTKKQGDTIMLNPEIAAYLQGIEIDNFISITIQYPETARENGIQGTVFVGFTIQADGKITDVDLVRGVHKLLDEEAIRVVKSIPQWMPAIHDGKPVASRYTWPIHFILR
jgi:TonB family protein